MKAKLQTWAWCMVLIAAMAIACEPMRLIASDAEAKDEYVLIDRYGELEFVGGRRIYPPAKIEWAPPTADPSTLGGACVSIGGLVEVTHDHLCIVQSHWPVSGYLEHDLLIPWDEVISAYNYETQLPIERPEDD